jgi:hypothetical protein
MLTFIKSFALAQAKPQPPLVASVKKCANCMTRFGLPEEFDFHQFARAQILNSQ